jgi:hypothetical protein
MHDGFAGLGVSKSKSGVLLQWCTVCEQATLAMHLCLPA